MTPKVNSLGLFSNFATSVPVPARYEYYFHICTGDMKFVLNFYTNFMPYSILLEM